MPDKIRASEADWIYSRGMPVYAVAHAKATVRGDSTVDADLARLERKVDGSGSFTVTDVVVNVDAWQEDDREGGDVKAVIPVTGATEHTVPLVYVNCDDSPVALQCGLKTECISEEGTVTVYAQIVPNDIIRLTILAMFAQDAERDIEVSKPDAPTIAYYKMPVATKDTLGGVKIGRNIDVDEDGTISAKGGACTHVLSGGISGGGDHVHTDECIKDLVATPDEVNDALNSALGIDPETDGQATDSPAGNGSTNEEYGG